MALKYNTKAELTVKNVKCLSTINFLKNQNLVAPTKKLLHFTYSFPPRPRQPS